MDRRIVIGILVGLLVVALGVGIAVNAYQAGVARGLAERAPEGPGQVRPGPDAVPPYGYHGPYWPRPWGFGFGFVFPLLFFVLLLVLLKALLWRPWGWGGPRRAFEEWHRQAHESPPPTQKM